MSFPFLSKYIATRTVFAWIGGVVVLAVVLWSVFCGLRILGDMLSDRILGDMLSDGLR